jgi:enterobactin synthetase component D / holo-[acyl-carrier protein] synthase
VRIGHCGKGMRWTVVVGTAPRPWAEATTMIETLLPAGVVTVEAFGADPDEPVHPGEERYVAQAIPSRRREFAAARRCAREALVRLGHQPTTIGVGPRREPMWPAGIVGSITHCVGYRAVALGSSDVIRSIGIDAEPHVPLPTGVLDTIAVDADIKHLAALTATDSTTCWDRLLFSAKESIYKAWFPVMRAWLGFEEATLIFDPAERTFQARVDSAVRRPDGGPAPTSFHGRYLVQDGLIVTAVVVRAERIAPPSHPRPS